MNLPGLRHLRDMFETIEWQAHQRILSHDFDFRLAEVEEDSPYPTQEELNEEDARELGRLRTWLRDNREDTRLACEPVVDWGIRLLAEIEEEQEVFEASPAERRGPAGDRSPEVCGGSSPLQSPSGGRPTSELLLDAAKAIESWRTGLMWGFISELRERAILLKGMGD